MVLFASGTVVGPSPKQGREANMNAAFHNHAKPSFSQSGEDQIIHFLFRAFRNQIALRYVDIGAAYPVAENNSYLFYTMGGSGLLVEADPDYAPQYASDRPGDRALNLAVVPERLAASGEVAFYAMHDRGWSTVSADHLAVADKLDKGGIRETLRLPCVTINDLLSCYWDDSSIDLLSIDIEGVDLEVLGELDTRRFRPRAIIAENSGGKPVHEATMREKGYSIYAYTHVNTIYIDPESFPI
jgi:FkbM family methyltransferase